MNIYQNLGLELKTQPKNWLITGCAGFIGSHLLEKLLDLNQLVVGLDNFATGSKANLLAVRERVGEKKWGNFKFHEGDIRNLNDCIKASTGVNYVLHEAALGSVPRSFLEPLETNDVNVNGFINILNACQKAGVIRLVYASSSSVYGDISDSLKIESRTGSLLSPYAISKHVTELYAHLFLRTHGLNSVGLRYFNVFGRRQIENSPYSAVIPTWIRSLLLGESVVIHGDGTSTRDFCYVENVVQANILAALAPNECLHEPVYNVAVGQATSLNELFQIITEQIASISPMVKKTNPQHSAPRVGNVMHSLASIEAAKRDLAYAPSHTILDGMSDTIKWYVQKLAR
jgi:UDP-N-acetylglucosamine 4-epimerase